MADEIGLPVVIRPAYILGGRGTGIASTREEFEKAAAIGLDASPISEILIEKSIAGWKEYELEVMRDRADNCVIVCSIENLDPMGVHTGDSITVAPAQTLSDVEYQQMRDAAFACIRRVGVETGGSNVQFAVNPEDGHLVIIEMNPRVSRSSALASKATGFPIAKIAARLAVGYTLDEIPNDITRKTPASFEPVIDYVVTKIPRWAFEKFPGTDGVLGTQMQSVGEAMAIGRTFPESLQKGMRSLEQGRLGLNADPGEQLFDELDDAELIRRAAIATPDRPFQLEAALRRGISVDDLYAATRVDPWFLDQILSITEERHHLADLGLAAMTRTSWRRAKRLGFSDAQLAYLWSSPGAAVTEREVRAARLAAGVKPTFKTVDTCAAEFDADTPYHYSTYEDEDEVRASDRPKIVILGSGPNRIGQGIEFDYCCVHASFALHDAGFETIMVNCNPETVSTDYDTSDRLYFEPLTYEDVMNVIEAEQPIGVVVALGGQTPLKLAGPAAPRARARHQPRLHRPGRGPRALERPVRPARDPPARGRHRSHDRGCPRGRRTGRLSGADAALLRARRSGHGDRLRRRGPPRRHGRPGRVRQPRQGRRPVGRATGAGRPLPGGRHRGRRRRHPRRHRRGAHRRRHGARRGGWRALGRQRLRAAPAQPVGRDHRGDRGVHPAHRRVARRPWPDQRPVRSQGEPGLRDRGQPESVENGAVRGQGHRACSWRRWPSRVMTGSTLAELRDEGVLVPRVMGDHIAVKEAVLPFARFPDADALLGPEMRSTGEVMGIDLTVGLAFAKSQLSAGSRLPEKGTVFLSLADRDKDTGVRAAERFTELGFEIAATSGTADHLREHGIQVAIVVAKLGEPTGTDAVELISSGKVQLVVNSPRGRGPRADGAHIRTAAGANLVPLLTTAAAGLAAANGMADWAHHPLRVRSLQEYHQGIRSDQLEEN